MTLRAYNRAGLYRAEGVGFFVYKDVCLVFVFFLWLCWVFVVARELSLQRNGGYFLVVVVLRLPIVVTSLLVDHRLALRVLGSRVVSAWAELLHSGEMEPVTSLALADCFFTTRTTVEAPANVL